MKIARPDGSVLSNVDISVVDRRVSVKFYTYPFSVSIDNASTIYLVRIAWNQGVLLLPIPFYIRRTQMGQYVFPQDGMLGIQRAGRRGLSWRSHDTTQHLL